MAAYISDDPDVSEDDAPLDMFFASMFGHMQAAAEVAIVHEQYMQNGQSLFNKGYVIAALREFDEGLRVTRCRLPPVINERVQFQHLANRILFEHGSSENLQEAHQYLEEIADYGIRCQQEGAFVSGHCFLGIAVTLARTLRRCRHRLNITDDRMGQIQLFFGLCALKVGCLEDLRYAADEAMSCLGLNNVVARFLAVHASRKEGKFGEAQEHIDKILSLEPQNEKARDLRDTVAAERASRASKLQGVPADKPNTLALHQDGPSVRKKDGSHVGNLGAAGDRSRSDSLPGLGRSVLPSSGSGDGDSVSECGERGDSPAAGNRQRSKGRKKKLKTKLRYKEIPRQRASSIPPPDKQLLASSGRVRRDSTSSQGHQRGSPAFGEPAKTKARQNRLPAAKETSQRLLQYLEETMADYKLGCRTCWVLPTNRDGVASQWRAKPREVAHDCMQNILLVLNKGYGTAEWMQVRGKPMYYQKGTSVCETYEQTGRCGVVSCSKPHGETEQFLWDADASKTMKIEVFMKDMKTSDLLPKAVLQRLRRQFKGELRLVCRKCHEDGLGFSGKRNHKPECEAADGKSHPWEKPIMIFSEEGKGVGEDENSTSTSTLLLTGAPVEGPLRELEAQLKSLLNLGLSREDILQIYKQQAQTERSLKANAMQNDLGHQDREHFDTEAVQICHLSEGDGYDCSDLEEEEDEDDVVDEEEEGVDNYKTAGNPYYELLGDKELKQLLRDKPDVYVVCTISLISSHLAHCVPVNGTDNVSRIHVRGRMNCGPAFDGDQVVVNILPDVREEGGVQVRVGRVVGIHKEVTQRKQMAYLCMADQFLAHLMRPLRSSVPKVHVLNGTVKADYPDQRECLVQVHAKVKGLKRIVKVDAQSRPKTLFLVRYLKWDTSQIYPLGYVTKVYKVQDTPQHSQKVLDILYQVRVRESLEISDLAKLTFSLGIPPLWKHDREDLRHLETLSIDPPSCTDVDDALSIMEDPTQPGTYKVWVHIADASKFIPKESPVDKDARARVFSFYPTRSAQRRSYNMLPSFLSENLCSLLAEQERLALSVSFHMTKEGKLCEERPLITESVIKNRFQLTYAQAEGMIALTVADPSWDVKAVKILYAMAESMRRERLRNGHWYQDIDREDGGDDAETNSRAHHLVEEFMILTNRTVAEYLREQYPRHTPLRRQRAPTADDRENWVASHGGLLPASLYFRRFADLAGTQGTSSGVDDAMVHVKRSTLRSMEKCLDDGRVDELVKLIGQEEMHPAHFLAMRAWYRIQDHASFVVSDDADDEDSGHFSLQLENYTQFTSPMRRYMDLVVHRLVKAALSDQTLEQMPYCRAELDDICAEVNSRQVDAKAYDKACRVLKAASSMAENPLYVPVTVSGISDDGLALCAPTLPIIDSSMRTVRYAFLSLSDKPEPDDDVKVKLTWERRVYEATGFHPMARTTASAKRERTVNTLLHSTAVRAPIWESMLAQLPGIDTEGDHADFSEKVRQTVESALQYQPRESGKCDEITSEMVDGANFTKHHVRFSLTAKRCLVLQLQYMADCLGQGWLQPRPCLLSITPKFDVCLLHQADPIRCFSAIATQKVENAYGSPEEYAEVWLPLLSMEAAGQAASEADPVVINRVLVSLENRGGKNYWGAFRLPKGFCAKRHIQLMRNSKEEEEESHDYICLRCTYTTPPALEGATHQSAFKRVWVAHAHTRTVTSEEDSVRAEFELKECHTDPPPCLLVGSGAECTVELLSKTLPFVRMEDAVMGIGRGNQDKLYTKIALGRNCGELDDRQKRRVPKDLKLSVFDAKGRRMPWNNEKQAEAIRRALSEPFTLIQGPPGTGKTLTGVKLVYWFVQANERLKEDEGQGGVGRRQVMYCGPSNSSVDVATKLLRDKLMKKCPKIVRVYSGALERQVFPVPRDTVQTRIHSGRRYELISKDSSKDIALHHLIRRPGNKFSKEINQFDRLFAQNKYQADCISDKEMEKYKKLLTDAAIHELPQYDVILCTCSASAGNRLTRACNIAQCIIDECGMCLEPESLVPLVAHSPTQVVLIGDHKQLSPIVSNQTAAKLGLGRSIFERYADRAIMLNTQYRMHPSISEFPSRRFYNGQLKNAEHSSWWEYTPLPIWPTARRTVFCHVEGTEKSLTLSGPDGNERSKSNEDERRHAVRMYLELVNRYQVPSRFIAVLTQYSAQRSEIARDLKAAGINYPKVDTVVMSQGDEWDYVILSTVRSLPTYEIDKRPTVGWLKRNMGFIVDPNQMNVALTRARRGLIILGNRNLLECDTMWRKLLRFYGQEGCLKDADDFLRPAGRTSQTTHKPRRRPRKI